MAALQLLKKEEEAGGSGGTTLYSFSSTTPDTIAKFLDTNGTVGDSAIVEVNGKVGIGVAAPDTTLHVKGGATALKISGNSSGWTDAAVILEANQHIWRGGGTYYHNTVGQYEWFWGRPYVYDDFVINRNSDAATHQSDTAQVGAAGVSTFLAIQGASGNVGIGTSSPSQKLDLKGALALRATASTNAWIAYTYNDNTFRLNFNGAGSDELVMDAAGNLGIGTTTPATRLHVAGDGQVTGALTVGGATTLAGGATVTGALHASGNITADGAIAAKYQDVAEWVDAVEDLPPGTVVAADPDSVNKVRRSQRAYDPAVLGVVSTQPGILLGDEGEGKVAVAQSGRVLVQVDARTGAIKPGDLLVASDIPGVAMVSKPGKGGFHRPGTIIGKALQGLATGRGAILVLITLQ
jgi:hypothetical protein